MKPSRVTLKSIQKQFLRAQTLLIISLTLILVIAGVLINLPSEVEKRDRNLQNIAEAIADSPMLAESGTGVLPEDVREYLDALKQGLADIDVISIVNGDCIRIYHSDHDLIGTVYDGTLPDFSAHEGGYYTVNEEGPSGKQRRAYAQIEGADGEPLGFVMAIMLRKNIMNETIQMMLVFLLISILAILLDLGISHSLSEKVKTSLMGYEPDVFTSMFQMRELILETLEEGILAVNDRRVIQFANKSAVRMLSCGEPSEVIGKDIDVLGDKALSAALSRTGQESHGSLSHHDIIFDQVPVREEDRIVGAIAVLRDRAEYTKLMEDLSWTRYLVDSMRANNHDFTNKLHVILGLIQMEMYEEAASYIQNITMVQRENISGVMNAVADPAVAALLIGKIARASELNVRFVLREGSHYAPSDMGLPSEMLITVIGNLLDNAYDAMNRDKDFEKEKELLFGIYSDPGAVVITVDDTGTGIRKEDIGHIFEKGWSTKGEGRGTGLHQIREMIENAGGTISVESEEGVGTSLTVSCTREG